MFWNNLNLRWKLTLPLIAIMLIVVVVAARQITAVQQVKADFNYVNNEVSTAFELLLNADRDLYQAQVAERSLLTDDATIPRADLVAQHDENLEQAVERMEQVVQMGLTSELTAGARQFQRDFEAWRALSEDLVTNLDNGSITFDEAHELSYGRSSELFDTARTALDIMGEEITTLRQEYATEVDASATSSVSVFIAGILLASGVAIFMAWFLPRTILTPVRRMNRSLKELASGGSDLTRRLPESGNDELGQLSQNFNRFLGMLQELIGEINNVSETVSEAASTVNGHSRKNSISLNDQFSSMEMAATAIEEMGMAVEEVSKNTQDMSNAADEADQNAKNVRQLFERAMGEVNQVALQAEQTSGTVRELEEIAKSIESIIDVISGIAEQTNLLALNAAIEAARAGEQGRGFAVVADEVRSLAKKTQESTTEIDSMIEKLQKGVSNAVGAMEKNRQMAKSTAGITDEAGDAMANVTAAITQISSMSLQIATAIEEQSTAVDNISEHMSKLHTLAGESNERAQQVSQIGEVIDEQADDLHKRLKQFGV